MGGTVHVEGVKEGWLLPFPQGKLKDHSYNWKVTKEQWQLVLANSYRALHLGLSDMPRCHPPNCLLSGNFVHTSIRARISFKYLISIIFYLLLCIPKRLWASWVGEGGGRGGRRTVFYNPLVRRAENVEIINNPIEHCKNKIYRVLVKLRGI